MRIEVHLFWHDRELHDKVDAVLVALKSMLKGEIIIMKEIDDLVAQAKANEDAEDSALLVINGIAARIDAAIAAAGSLSAADKATLTSLSSDLKAHASPLAAAVVANTPAA